MPQVRFDPMIPVFERAKTVNALDRAATVIGLIVLLNCNISHKGRNVKMFFKSLSECYSLTHSLMELNPY
jgi:hypothetical protein